MATDRKGRLVIISGPSGVGKSTLVEALLKREPRRLRLSVSATTRPPRPGEIDGQHYHFLSLEEFASRRARGEFLECMEVFGRGHWYGTLWDEVRPSLAGGVWVILEIDVDGARAVLDRFPEVVRVFVAPESTAELERRLRARQTDSEAAIERRLEVARHELAEAPRYDYQVVNRDVNVAVDEIVSILIREGFAL